MAARTDTITIKYTSDISGLTRDQRKLETQVKKSQKNADKLGKDLESNYKKGSKGAKAFGKETIKAKQKVSVLDKSIKKMGVAVGAAFAIGAIVSFAKEAIKLGAELQGVRAGFEKLANSEKLLNQLKIATRGTVTELELMKQAVRAKNFEVPLEKLAQFFKFATQRALETGESVDFLVNSIIVGIGRKSALVLDNLGISAIRIQEETKKMGDFGAAAAKIIAEELEKTGEVADTNAVKIGRLSTKWEEFKTNLGDSDIVGNVAQSLVTILTVYETLLDRIVSAQNEMLNKEQTVGFTFAAGIKARITATEDLEQAIIDANKARQQAANVAIRMTQRDEDGLFQQKLLIQQHEILIKVLEEEVIKRQEADRAQKANIRNIFFLKKEIAELTIIIDSEVSSIADINEALKSRVKLEKELKAALEGRTLAEVEAATLEKLLAKERKTRVEDQIKDVDTILKSVQDREQAENLQRVNELEGIDDGIKAKEKEVRVVEQSNIRIKESDKEKKDAQLEASIQLAAGLSELGAALIKDERKRALFLIGLNTAISIAELVKDTQQIGLTPIEKGILFAAGLAQITAGIILAKQQLDQSFHEGEVDINPEKKNSKGEFTAKLIKGESVIKASRTKQYKQELEAIQAGNLEHVMIDRYLGATLKGLGITTEKFNDNRMIDRMDRIIKKNNGSKEMIEAMDRNSRDSRRYKNRMY